MTVFTSKGIRTDGHHMLGITWPFRGYDVEMVSEGFQCSCKTKPKFKCKHIKWVEMNILGVNAKEFNL